MLQNLKSVSYRAVASLIDIEKYPKSEEGFQQFIDDLHDLFKARDEKIKEKIKDAGGYPVFYSLGDKYFSNPYSTVDAVTAGFLKLLRMETVTGDPNNYRDRMKDYFDFERERFAFPSHFAVALQLCIQNPEVLPLNME